MKFSSNFGSQESIPRMIYTPPPSDRVPRHIGSYLAYFKSYFRIFLHCIHIFKSLDPPLANHLHKLHTLSYYDKWNTLQVYLDTGSSGPVPNSTHLHTLDTRSHGSTKHTLPPVRRTCSDLALNTIPQRTVCTQ